MNRPLGAPVNGHPIQGGRSRSAPRQAVRVAGRIAPGRGVWGAGGKRGGRRSRGVLSTRFRPFGPFEIHSQIFFTPLKPRNPA
jgi:hypothetical protein